MEEGVGLAVQGVSKCMQSTLINGYKELVSCNNLINIYETVSSVPPLFDVVLYWSVFSFSSFLFFRIFTRLSKHTKEKDTHVVKKLYWETRFLIILFFILIRVQYA